MVVAGVAHFVEPRPFVQHLPEVLPGRGALVALTGVLEIGFGVALVVSKERRAAVGRLLALFLLAIWPANIYVAAAGVEVDGLPGGAYPWIRLPFQILLVVWALWSTRPPRGSGATDVAGG